MSFTGSTQRIWRTVGVRGEDWAHAGWVTLAVLALVVAWAAVLCWYLLWGIWLIPYRILRRGARRRQRDELRHRELLAELENRR